MLTGFDAHTCPLWYVAFPWVRHVLEVRAAKAQGSLDAGVARLPLAAAMLDAIAEVDHAEAEKLSRDRARAEAEIEEMRRKNGRGHR